MEDSESEIEIEVLKKGQTPLKSSKLINKIMQKQDEKEKFIFELKVKDEDIKKETKMEIENQPQQGKSQSFKRLKQQKRKGKPQYTIFKDFHCTLNLVDLSYGQKGHNKFYIIQILKKGPQYHFVKKWGRVGANPNQKVDVFPSVEIAIGSFHQKFKQKTGNLWRNRHNFQQVTGKYTYIHTDQKIAGSGLTVKQEIEIINQRNQKIMEKINTIKTKLPPQIALFMKFIWNIKKMRKTMQNLHFDTKKNPLGRLSMVQIQKGYKILRELQNVVINQKKRHSRIEKLSSEFYTHIPQSFGMKLPPAIDTVNMIREKTHLLEALKEIHSTQQLINRLFADQKNNTEINPLDYFHDFLKIKISSLQTHEQNFQTIKKAIINTHGPTHDRFSLEVDQIYQVERQGEDIRYLPFQQLPNQSKRIVVMLWHGSRSINFVGILNQGCRIAPPEAPSTGYMFGKGIYFADVASKSAQYCGAKTNSPEGLLLLCQVALGNFHEVGKSQPFQKPPKYYHSVKALGLYNPDQNQSQQFGKAKLMTGELCKNQRIDSGEFESKLKYNEYCIYDVGQVIFLGGFSDFYRLKQDTLLKSSLILNDNLFLLYQIIIDQNQNQLIFFLNKQIKKIDKINNTIKYPINQLINQQLLCYHNHYQNQKQKSFNKLENQTKTNSKNLIKPKKIKMQVLSKINYQIKFLQPNQKIPLLSIIPKEVEKAKKKRILLIKLNVQDVPVGQ